MHCIELIIIRNAEAAGRELGHAANDLDTPRCLAIEDAHSEEPHYRKAPIAFDAAFYRARQEG